MVNSVHLNTLVTFKTKFCLRYSPIMKKIYVVFYSIMLVLGWTHSQAQISITSLPYQPATTDFNTYNPTSAANLTATLPAGWTAASSSTAAYKGPSSNPGTTGGYYAFSQTGNTSDYSIGALRTTSTGNITYAVSFTNNSGTTITSITLGWDYKQFSFNNTSGWNCSGTGALAGNTTLDNKDFTGASSGTTGSGAITSVTAFNLNGLSIAPGQTFGISWVTVDISGSDNGIGIDNFSIIASAVNSVPTKLAVTSVTPASPVVSSPFAVSVQVQDANNTAINVTASTPVNLAVTTGSGTLAGVLSGTIPVGSNTITFSNLSYNVAENGVVLTATDASATPLASGASSPFNVLATASQLSFVNIPTTGAAGTSLSSFTVEARRPDNTVDNTYTGTITLTKASGPGVLTGTTSVAAVAGVATFNAIQLSQAGTYTLTAGSGTLSTATSPSIVISPVTAPTDYFRSNVTSGTYNTAGSWQSSTDSLNWISATAAPTGSARSISIQNGHTITVSATGSTGNQIRIRSGGTLVYTTSIFTLANGSGDDLIIENGGRLAMNSSPITLASGATARIQTGGIASTNVGTTVVSPDFGASSSYSFETDAVLEYTAAAQPTISGVTIFPASADYPVLRFAVSLSGNIGGTGPTIINGRVEVPTGVSVGFTSSGVKIFKGGIINDGPVTFGSSTPFQITGTNAVLGGSGTLLIGNTAGLTIVSGADVRLLNDKTISNTNTSVSTVTVAGTLNTNGFVLSGNTAFTAASGAKLQISAAAGITPSGTTGNIQSSGARTYNASATYEYNGTSAQNTGSGLPTTIAGLAITNLAGVTLSNPTTLSGSLALTSGVLTTSTAAPLTLSATATLTGGSASAYVGGPVSRATNATSSYVFPVGRSGRYMPVRIAPDASTASTYTVEFFNTGTPDYQNVTAPLASVDAGSWFEISRASGGANAAVTLPYDAATNVTDATTLVLAHRPGAAGTPWVSEGGTVSGTNTSGTVTSGIVSSFSPFAIGSTATQPLPVKLASFTLQTQAQAVQLDWQLAGTAEAGMLVVERSQDGRQFEPLHRQSMPSKASRYTDLAPVSGMNYYRLAITDVTGATSYSQILTASFSGIEPVQAAFPNPASSYLFADFQPASLPATGSLINLAGQQVWSQEILTAGRLEVPVQNLPAGVYQFQISSGTGLSTQRVQIVH
ncbi:MAG: T9SS type A sorting domain-containing protein [Sphingobacteriales bacterium]|nr:MAG: T9SS type A sorting domain-containing protein [Sphingobacteriales bacterium]